MLARVFLRTLATLRPIATFAVALHLTPTLHPLLAILIAHTAPATGCLTLDWRMRRGRTGNLSFNHLENPPLLFRRQLLQLHHGASDPLTLLTPRAAKAARAATFHAALPSFCPTTRHLFIALALGNPPTHFEFVSHKRLLHVRQLGPDLGLCIGRPRHVLPELLNLLALFIGDAAHRRGCGPLIAIIATTFPFTRRGPCAIVAPSFRTTLGPTFWPTFWPTSTIATAAAKLTDLLHMLARRLLELKINLTNPPLLRCRQAQHRRRLLIPQHRDDGNELLIRPRPLLAHSGLPGPLRESPLPLRRPILLNRGSTHRWPLAALLILSKGGSRHERKCRRGKDKVRSDRMTCHKKLLWFPRLTLTPTGHCNIFSWNGVALCGLGNLL